MPTVGNKEIKKPYRLRPTGFFIIKTFITMKEYIQMGFINLLHNGYTGKLGQTVGAKVNGELILRTYNPHNNSNTEKQKAVKLSFTNLLKESTRLYSNSLNIKAPKGSRLNNFNFFARAISNGLKEIGSIFKYYELTTSKNTRMLIPVYFVVDGEYFMPIRLSGTDGLIPEKPPKVIGFLPDGIKMDETMGKVIGQTQKTINATPNTNEELFFFDKTFLVQLPNPLQSTPPETLGYFALEMKLNGKVVTTPCIELKKGLELTNQQLIPN